MRYSTENLASYKRMFKLIMLGRASCGKTSLLVRFVDSHFGNEMASIGVDMKSMAVMINDNECMRL
jgi:GTPase SAR1 family protein